MSRFRFATVERGLGGIFGCFNAETSIRQPLSSGGCDNGIKTSYNCDHELIKAPETGDDSIVSNATSSTVLSFHAATLAGCVDTNNDSDRGYFW